MDDKQYKQIKDKPFSQLFEKYAQIAGGKEKVVKDLLSIKEERPAPNAVPENLKAKQIGIDQDLSKAMLQGQDEFLRRAFAGMNPLEEQRSNSVRIIIEGNLVEEGDSFVRVKTNKGKTVKIPKNYITSIE